MLARALGADYSAARVLRKSWPYRLPKRARRPRQPREIRRADPTQVPDACDSQQRVRDRRRPPRECVDSLATGAREARGTAPLAPSVTGPAAVRQATKRPGFSRVRASRSPSRRHLQQAGRGPPKGNQGYSPAFL